MSALNGEIVVLGQHAGDDIQLRVYGDEFYGRYETLDGYTVLYDVNRGLYTYATLAAGRFVSTGIPVAKPVPAGLRRHLKEDPEARNERFGLRYDRLRPPEDDAGVTGVRTFGPDNGLLSGRKLHQGSVTGLTILVNFADIATQITREQVDAMFNGENYKEHGNFCSVREYFDIVSSGKLDYTNVVVGPVQLSQRRSHYLNTLMVEEAMDLVVSDLGINLTQFDSRGEGIIDAINVLYAGESQYVGDLWPHNSFITLQYGPIRTHYYQLTGLGTHPVDLRTGTICHENGHLLCRFPDMYDYGKRDGDHEKSQGIGRYCLMGSGNHLNDRRTPSPVCAYLRDLAGWADTTVSLNGPGNRVAEHGAYDVVMKYELGTPNEYFLVENRAQLGLDTHLPDGGLAVFHCDTLGSNEWQEGTRNEHYQCGLVQADGHLDLENNRNPGDAGDLFTDAPGIALSHATVPDSRQWDGTDSGLTISDVGPTGASMSFTIGPPQAQPTTGGMSSPNLLIPDADAVGVEDAIAIDAVGTLAAINLRVEIFHTWIGDLDVTLVAPNGSQVSVHSREGGNTRDLIATIKSADHIGLAGLVGAPIQGTWKLRVVDDVQRDVGRLAHWSIDIAFDRTQVASGYAEPDTAIPDSSSAGIESLIGLEYDGTVSDITVSVDIEHTFIGDLQVDLVAPSGASARLHDNDGGSQDDIVRSYDLTSTPALTPLIGQPIKGDWRLRVRDIAAVDVGRLKAWSLNIGP